MLSSGSHSFSNLPGNTHGQGYGGVRFPKGASSGSFGHDRHGSGHRVLIQHHHQQHRADHHIQGHELAAFPASIPSSSVAPTAAQITRPRPHAAQDSSMTRTQSAPPPALAAASQQHALPTAMAADSGLPLQPPKKKLRPSHHLPLATATSPSPFRLPSVHRPLALSATANYDVDAFARLAMGARSGHTTRPPVVDAGLAATSLTAMAALDRRVQAQAARRMRERAGERAGVVQWLVHLNAIHASFRFAPETIYTGVQYMDRALASSPTSRKHLAPRKPHMYLLAVVCLTLAAKYAEEYAAPSVAGILAALATVPPPAAAATGLTQAQAQAMMPAWTQKHVLAMERKVLEALDFDLAAVAPSAAVFELLFANVDLAIELCALVMSGGQSAVASPTVSTTGLSPGPSPAPIALSSRSAAAAAGFMSPRASPRSIASSTSSASMVPPSPVSPTGEFGHEVFMAPQAHQYQQQASRTFGVAAAAARPYPPPVAPPAHGVPVSAAQAKWTMYSAPASATHHQDQHPKTAAGDLSPMDLDPLPTKHHMCMMTPPHTPPRAPTATTQTSSATPSPTSSDERWPAALASPAHRNLIARLVRAVQTELVQRILVHTQGTAHAPLNTAVVLLNRAVVCLAAANRAAAAVAGAQAAGSGLDPSPMATPGATGTVTVAGTGAAVAQVAGIVSHVECVATEERTRGEWGACVEMVRQAVGGQVVGLAA